MWRKAVGFEEAVKLRTFETRDIFKRLGVISPNRLFINNFPLANPTTVFNASFIVERGEVAEVYARIVLGYFLYVSAIVRIEVPVSDILEGGISINYYSSEIVVYPSTRYDIWGCEDPRVYYIDGKLYMTYAGRSSQYFRPATIERVLPVTAVSTGNGKSWSKLYVHTLPSSMRMKVETDKDAFIVKIGDDYYLFHRPHLWDGKHYLLVSKMGLPQLPNPGSPQEVSPVEMFEVMPIPDFELKIGWACPVTVSSRRAVALVHGVDKELEVYRVFAVELELGKEIVVAALTPFYVMEPRTPYEIYGDRPYTIFPCGAQIVDNKLIVSYGAADFMIGFAAADFSELMSALDKGRLY